MKKQPSRTQLAARRADVRRIRKALEAAQAILKETCSSLVVQHKQNGDPVTTVERAVNRVLRRHLVRPGEGWLSEETVDRRDRLSKSRVWIVDPVDGTKEFISGIPEWCISAALVEDGIAVAGGICNPATHELIVGSLETQIEVEGLPAVQTSRQRPLVLASRSEVNRGEWEKFCDLGAEIRPMGSVAYKLALVAAGVADATWTLVPKHEWDVAAGVALVFSSGGKAWTNSESLPIFNKPEPLFPTLVAVSKRGAKSCRGLLPSVDPKP